DAGGRDFGFEAPGLAVVLALDRIERQPPDRRGAASRADHRGAAANHAADRVIAAGKVDDVVDAAGRADPRLGNGGPGPPPHPPLLAGPPAAPPRERADDGRPRPRIRKGPPDTQRTPRPAPRAGPTHHTAAW